MTRAIFNAFLLFLSQVGGYIIPLLEIPFLTRVISPSVLGEVFFVQSWALTLSLVVEYGFNYNATKKIAENRDSKEAVSSVISEVCSAKILLCFVIILLVMIGVAFLLPIGFQVEWVFFAVLQFLGFSFSPYWYFQGKEQLKGVVAFDVTVRFLALAGLFYFIKNDEDAGLILLIQGASGFILTILTNLIMFHREGIPKIDLTKGIYALRDGWHFFVFKSSSSILLSMNSILVGFLTSMELLALYVGAEKIMKAVLGLSNPVITAFYPYFCSLVKRDRYSYLKQLKLFVFILTLLGVFGVVIGLELYEWIINYFLGEQYAGSKDILFIYLFLIPLRMLSQSISVGYLLPNEKVKETGRIVFISTIINFILAFVLMSFFSVYGMVYTILSVEVFLITALIMICMKKV